ncbi:Glycosyltransferase involved in cell wall bisynthesis [Methanophagales archaeon]|nr:Glycosyltransferase involved in cell wall bisynthesis [Methanophagales archaeon]
MDDSAIGGIEVALLELCKELVSIGHDVTILAGARDTVDERFIDGVQIIPVDFINTMRQTWSSSVLCFPRQLLFPIAALKRELKRYDVYHGHIYLSGLIANYLARKNRAIAVNTIHGSYYPVWDMITNPFRAKFYKTAERFLAPALARQSHLQIHTGGYFAKQVLAWGAPEDKVKVIHNGVNLEQFHPGVEPLAHDHSIPILLTVRRLVKKNGLEYLIRAMKYVLMEEQCQLMVIGDGMERRRLELLSAHLGISAHVEFTGSVPHNILPRYLSLADIAVLPSLIEASSLFALEAMAMGKPIIATSVGGLPEILGEGCLVSPMEERELADKIIQILQNKKEREKLARQGQAIAEEHTWEIVARQTAAEYERIVNVKKEVRE